MSLETPPVHGASDPVERPLILRFAETIPVLQVPDDLAFEPLRDWVRARMPEHLAAIGGRASRLDLGAREIKLFDLRRLVHLLREEFNVEITGIYVSRAVIHRFAERELKLRLLPLDWPGEDTPAVEVRPEEAETEEAYVAAPEADVRLETITLPTDLVPTDLPPDPAPVRAAVARDPGRRTQTIHRTIRSGTVVQFDGDLYVFGDVNPGAQVIATGSITVLGTLKGMAHAGAAGDESTAIFALHLRPTQMRIGRRIALSPAESAHTPGPEIATVSADSIVIEPYRGKVRSA
ncbi:MAG: septum site-determining protein MinC [Deltaproteobacteria bacterium]|nr:septum site-determining protein MinC [Deltaproteobacteria bacterium]